MALRRTKADDAKHTNRVDFGGDKDKTLKRSGAN